MRESEFVRHNREKWERFHGVSTHLSQTSPDELSRIYLDVTTDLAFAQTHFAESPVTAYLERLSLTFHQHLYARRTDRWSEIVRLLTRDIPLAFYESRRDLLVALSVFVVSMIIGIASQCADDTFANFILGDSYVDMTLANIAKGDPMHVYKDADTGRMFLGIWMNNTMIDFRTFLSGLMALPGALIIIIYNGVMFGCFETFLIRHGAVDGALFVVNLHGSLEIPTIVMAGAAAVAMGTGWIFPDQKSRMAAFRDGARRGVLMLLGTLPFTFVAALIETYVTRHTEVPIGARAAFVIAGLAITVYLTVILPRKVHRHASAL